MSNGWSYNHHSKDLAVLKEVVADIALGYLDAFERSMNNWYLFRFSILRRIISMRFKKD